MRVRENKLVNLLHTGLVQFPFQLVLFIKVTGVNKRRLLTGLYKNCVPLTYIQHLYSQLSANSTTGRTGGRRYGTIVCCWQTATRAQSYRQQHHSQKHAQTLAHSATLSLSNFPISHYVYTTIGCPLIQVHL